MLSRRSLIRGIVGGAGHLQFGYRGSVSSRSDQPLGCALPTRRRTPATVRAEPFSTPLPIPPTVRPGTDPIVLPVTWTAVSLLPGATTTMLTFGGSFPGPTVIARPGQVVDIDVVNELDEPAVLHLHGAHVAAVHDGHVRDLVPAGGQRRYTFDNAQRAAHLWYHDHLLMRTAERVYRGLAGSYLLIDPAHDGLGLPNGDERDIPVTLTDKTFDADGQLVYDPVGHTGFLGDVVLVNGVDRPVLTVEPGLLRLRILNASNARPYRLGRADGVPLVQVGTDGGLLAAPASRGEVEVWPSERIDLLLDLSRMGDGDRVVIVDAGVGDLMAVDVTGGPAEPAILPTSLGPAPALDPPEVVRTITLDEHGGRFLLNGHGFDDAVRDVYARLGAVERWRLVNTTSFGHPIHLHLVSFLVRQRTSSGVALPLRPEDEGWKDTVLVRAFETVELDARFADHLGDFMYHCHVLEHEDHDMMSQFRVVDLGRIAGSNRVRTAAAVSAHGGGTGGTVVVASGLEWAGALAGAALADALALVLGESLDEAAEEELRRRGPDRIVVAGSTGQVSAAIEGVLAGIAPTSRVDADDPVELAAGVARTLADRADRVVVATADRFPDALAAGVLGIPVLLTIPTALSATCRQAIADLGASSVVIAGGPAAVSEDVAAELTGQGLAVTRVAGPDRIATAAAFARTVGLRTTAYAASATRFPDALSAGIAARRDGMLVLVDDTGATAVTDQLLADAQVDRIRIVGGEAAVGLAAEAMLAAHL